MNSFVRRFIFACDRPLGLIHPLVAVLLAWVIDYGGFMHGFTVCLLIWWTWERRPSANAPAHPRAEKSVSTTAT